LRTASSVSGSFGFFAPPLALPPTGGVFCGVAVDESSDLVVADEDGPESQPTAKMAASGIASSGENLLMDGVSASNEHDQLRDGMKLAMPSSRGQEVNRDHVAHDQAG
jgi:hypothetical protein